MIIEKDISDLEIDIINLDSISCIQLSRQHNCILVDQFSKYNLLSKPVVINYIDLLLHDIRTDENRYRIKYPNLYRKYKLKRIVNNQL